MTDWLMEYPLGKLSTNLLVSNNIPTVANTPPTIIGAIVATPLIPACGTIAAAVPKSRLLIPVPRYLLRVSDVIKLS